MAEELISQYIDEPSIKKQTDFLLAQLDSVSKKFDALEGREISLKGATNSKEVVANLKAAADANRDLARSQDELVKATILAEKAQQAKLKTEQESIKITKEAEKVEGERAKTAVTSAKVQTEAAKASAAAKVAEAKALTEAARARDLEAKTTMAYNRENDRSIAIITKEEKALELLASDYKVLSLAQKDAIARYQNLVLLVGAGDPVAKAAGAEAAVLTAQLTKVDEATGVYTRNVGNYFGAIGQAFSKTYGFLRVAANIIPGLGISGILLLAYEGISKLVEVISSGGNALNTFKENYKNVLEVVENANKQAGKQIADLKILYSAATDVNNSIDARRLAVNALQEEFPDYFGKIKDETILNGKAKDAYNALAASIVTASRATAAKGKIDDIEKQKLDIIFQNQKIETAANNEKARAQATDFRDEEGRSVVHYTKLQQEALIDQRKRAAQSDQDKKFQSLDEQEKFLITFAGESAITKVVVDENTKRDKVKKEKKEKEVKETQSLYDRIVEMEKVFNSRDRDIGAPDDTKENALRDLIIKNTSASIAKIVSTSKEGYVKDLENLKASLDQGLITRAEYEKRVLALKKVNEREDLDNAIALNEAIISNLKARGIDVLEYEKKLNELKAKLYEEDANNSKAAEEKKRKAAEDVANAKGFLGKKEVELAKETSNLLVTLVTASIQNQRNAIVDLENTQELNYENEVKRINASALTDQQKEQQLNNLKAQRDAEKSKNDRDQRDLQTKQAKFERLQAVASIIAATAKAEVQALTYLSNPFTAPLYPSIAAIIAATGAVQLATLLATPLPRYFKGKNVDDNYEGNAWVGDGGRAEVIYRESGSVEVTPDRPTVTYLKRNDIVYPSIDAYRNRLAMSQTDKVLSNGVLVQQTASIDMKPLERKMDGVINAINGKPTNETVWTERGVITRVKHGFSETEYINRYVKGM